MCISRFIVIDDEVIQRNAIFLWWISRECRKKWIFLRLSNWKRNFPPEAWIGFNSKLLLLDRRWQYYILYIHNHSRNAFLLAWKANNYPVECLALESINNFHDHSIIPKYLESIWICTLFASNICSVFRLCVLHNNNKQSQKQVNCKMVHIFFV